MGSLAPPRRQSTPGSPKSTRAALKVLADELGLTVAQLAPAWLLAQGDDVVPIPGTRKLERIAENAQAAAVSLAPETLARIDAIAGRTRWAGDRRSFAAHGVTRRATSD
ncbi:hypothetical protein CIW54_12600 [Paraburkholderia sp. T12-10]|nr:hypothetical protein CIW54_12600 [Paraburkholderia sp. T12-10]